MKSIHRRGFIKNLGAIAGAAAFTTFHPGVLASTSQTLGKYSNYSPSDLAVDEDFWYQVQKAYYQSPHFINLEAGYFSPQPTEVMKSQEKNIEMINEQPSFYMRTRQHKENDAVKKMLADFAGTSSEEIVITRNTTESLNTIILGYPWQSGDEAIITDQDYPNMVEAFMQAEDRHGIKVKTIKLPLHPDTDEEIVSVFEQAITSKTKVILCTHMINLTGQILPVKKICDMAHSKGIEVMVDGAHTFAHLDFKIPDLDADYYAASLHKWLCSPLGLGIMYIRKDKIEKIWPLMGDTSAPRNSIQKFERTGTRPLGSNLTIADALKFHNAIGSSRKKERLDYLKYYWCDKVKDMDGVVLNTPLEKGRSCAIANVRIEGKSPEQLAEILYAKHKIFTVAIDHGPVQGVRITPHLYTTINDLDKLVEAIKEIVAS